jgi:hypothetical protein
MGLGAGFHLIDNHKDHKDKDKERKSKDKDKGQDVSSTKLKDKEKDQDVSSAKEKEKEKEKDVPATKTKDKEKEEGVLPAKRKLVDDPPIDTSAVSYGWTAMIEDWLCSPTNVGATASAPISRGEALNPRLALNNRPISSVDLARRLSKKDQRQSRGREYNDVPLTSNSLDSFNICSLPNAFQGTDDGHIPRRLHSQGYSQFHQRFNGFHLTYGWY